MRSGEWGRRPWQFLHGETNMRSISLTRRDRLRKGHGTTYPPSTARAWPSTNERRRAAPEHRVAITSASDSTVGARQLLLEYAPASLPRLGEQPANALPDAEVAVLERVPRQPGRRASTTRTATPRVRRPGRRRTRCSRSRRRSPAGAGSRTSCRGTRRAASHPARVPLRIVEVTVVVPRATTPALLWAKSSRPKRDGRVHHRRTSSPDGRRRRRT